MLTWAFEAISEGMHASCQLLSNFQNNHNHNHNISNIKKNNNELHHHDDDNNDSTAATHGEAPLPSNYIKKEKRNGTLYGVDGTTELCCHQQSNNDSVNSQHKDEVSTWRSHHTFSARCALVDPKSVSPSDNGKSEPHHANGRNEGKQKQEDAGGPQETPAALLHEAAAAEAGTPTTTSPLPPWVNTDTGSYHEWEAAFYLKASSHGGGTASSPSHEEDPHFLISVAPFFYHPGQHTAAEATADGTPSLTVEDYEHYKHHMLDTPLIWEEPFTVSLDIHKNGMHLWSEHLQRFSHRVVFPPRSSEVPAGCPPPHEGLVLRHATNADGSSARTDAYYDTIVGLKWVQPANADHAKLYVSYCNSGRAACAEGQDWCHATEAIDFPLHEMDQCGHCHHVASAAAETTKPTPPFFFFCPYVTLLEGGQEALIL